MRDFSFERKTSLDKIVKRFKKVSKYEGQFSLTNILTFSRLPSLPPSLPPFLSLTNTLCHSHSNIRSL